MSVTMETSVYNYSDIILSKDTFNVVLSCTRAEVYARVIFTCVANARTHILD